MDHIHVLIIEDELIVALDLATGLEKDGYIVAGIADNYEEARTIFTEKTVDILLMDIHIKGEKDGIETAVELLQQKNVPVIFITAYSDPQTVERVKSTAPAAFLTKPYSLDNVRIAIELAIHQLAAKETARLHPAQQSADKNGRRSEKEQFLHLEDAVFVKQNYRFVKFHLHEIAYISADNNHTIIHVGPQKIIVRISLSELLDKLQFSKLVRVHRSFAVNLDKISSFDDELIKVPDFSVPIGRNFKPDFLKNFNIR